MPWVGAMNPDDNGVEASPLLNFFIQPLTTHLPILPFLSLETLPLDLLYLLELQDCMILLLNEFI